MDERFDEGLAPDRLAALNARRDGPGLVRLGVQLAAGLASGLVLVRAAAPWEWALGLGAQAVAQLGFFATLHECAHRTAFRSRALNELGGWIAALCQLMAPPLMRAFHFAHHRHTHDVARDPELAGLERMARWPRGVEWLATMTGLPILLGRIVFTLVAAVGAPPVLASRLLPYLTAQRRAGVVAGSLALVLIHVGLVLLALRFEPRLLRLYLAVPLAHALLTLYVTCEHRGLPTEGDIFARTRSLDPGPLVRWWMWNMPYHAEHHAYPAVPFHALPALRAELEPRLVHRGGLVGLHLRSGG
jgi:fatty acid desaturase